MTVRVCCQQESQKHLEIERPARVSTDGFYRCRVRMTSRLAAFMGCDRSSRTEVWRRVKEHIADYSLIKRKRGVKVVYCDDVLKSVLKKRKVPKKEVNALLSLQMKAVTNLNTITEQMTEAERKAARERRLELAAKPEAIQRKRLRQARKSAAVNTAMANKRTEMLKVWYLSEPMAAFVGRHTATKAEALAAVEKHILANNLVHQRKPHWIVCDETLRALLHRTKVTVTRIPKYVRKELRDPLDLQSYFLDDSGEEGDAAGDKGMMKKAATKRPSVTKRKKAKKPKKRAASAEVDGEDAQVVKKPKKAPSAQSILTRVTRLHC